MDPGIGNSVELLEGMNVGLGMSIAIAIVTVANSDGAEEANLS